MTKRVRIKRGMSLENLAPKKENLTGEYKYEARHAGMVYINGEYIGNCTELSISTETDNLYDDLGEVYRQYVVKRRIYITIPPEEGDEESPD